MCENEGVDFRLRPMERVGRFRPSAQDGFYFFNQQAIWGLKNPIDASFDGEHKLGAFDLVFDADFGLVALRTQPLDFLMTARALESAGRGKEIAIASQISTPQYKFNHFANRNGDGASGLG